MTPGQTSQSRGMPHVPIGIYFSPVTVQRGGLWLILWQLSLPDRSLGPLLYHALMQRERCVYDIFSARPRICRPLP